MVRSPNEDKTRYSTPTEYYFRRMSIFNQTVAVGKPQDSIANATTELEKFVASDSNYDDLSKRVRVYNERKFLNQVCSLLIA